MPQTSPMNWTILSLLMMTSILNIYSLNNEKTNYKNSLKMKFHLNMMSWNW